MPKEEYIPVFPYKGDQAIISSGRIMFHAKDDSIFIFGKKAVGISSVGVVNIDNYEGTAINSPKIELGINAKIQGQPVLLGKETNRMLSDILADINGLAAALSVISKTGLAAATINIASQGEILKSTTQRYIDYLDKKDAVGESIAPNLSKITFTR
jgi:hypothetical protein